MAERQVTGEVLGARCKRASFYRMAPSFGDLSSLGSGSGSELADGVQETGERLLAGRRVDGGKVFGDGDTPRYPPPAAGELRGG